MPPFIGAGTVTPWLSHVSAPDSRSCLSPSVGGPRSASAIPNSRKRSFVRHLAHLFQHPHHNNHLSSGAVANLTRSYTIFAHKNVQKKPKKNQYSGPSSHVYPSALSALSPRPSPRPPPRRPPPSPLAFGSSSHSSATHPSR